MPSIRQFNLKTCRVTARVIIPDTVGGNKTNKSVSVLDFTRKFPGMKQKKKEIITHWGAVLSILPHSFVPQCVCLFPCLFV